MKHKWIVIPVVILIAGITMFHFKKNRVIELTKETLVYGIGGNKEDVYLISSLEKNQEGKDIIYTINYKNSDVKFTRSFYYHPEHGGSIQFKHQEHITWRKKANTVIQ